MEELTKEADAKVQMLKYTSAKTRGVVEKGNLGAVERQRENLKELGKEINALKLRIEQTMFEAGKSVEEVENWSSNVEGPIAEAHGEIASLETWLQDTSKEAERQKQRDEEERRARARKEELKFEREQMQMKLEFERELEETKVHRHPAAKAEQSQQRATKLPKLEITKFKGTYEEWLPFWNKFQTARFKGSDGNIRITFHNVQKAMREQKISLSASMGRLARL